MKKLTVLLLVLALMPCGLDSASADIAGVSIAPAEHQWIEQGNMLTFTVKWWNGAGLERLEWLMDGVVVAQVPLFGQASGVSAFNLYGSDYEVKTFPSGEISSYEFGCQLYDTSSPVDSGWDEVVVYVCPQGYESAGGEAPDDPLDVPCAITSLSWHKVVDYLGDEYLGVDVAWTPVDGAIGYEVFTRTGPDGAFTQKTECIETSVLAGFPLPAVDTIYYFKVRAAWEGLIPNTDEYEYLTGPFSAVASIAVPAITTAWMTVSPLMTLSPPLHLIPRRTPAILQPDGILKPIQTPSPAPTLKYPTLKTIVPPLPIHTIAPVIPIRR